MKRVRWILLGVLLLGGLIAQAEDITISTYYPSPRGVYDELRANVVTLMDKTTGQFYSLSVNEGRLLVSDDQSKRQFILVEFPQEKE